MQNEFDFLNEEISNHERQIDFHKACILDKKIKLQELTKQRTNSHKFEPGKFCWFWDAFNDEGKKIRPMIRPYHHSENTVRGERHYSADLEGFSIGHGWKYCKLVTLSEIVGRIIQS
jgi:hypothetical protein